MSTDNIFHIESLRNDRVKEVASEISNETGRRILVELYKNSLSISELSNKLNIPLSTTQYHINKLVELGLVKVAGRKIGKRLQDVKLYTFDKEGIIITSTWNSDVNSILKKMYITAILFKSTLMLLLFVIGTLTSIVGGMLLEQEVYRCLQAVFQLIPYYGLPTELKEVIKPNILMLYVIVGISYILGVLSTFLIIILKIKINK